MKNVYLPPLLLQIEQHSFRAGSEFGTFSPAQLNWKPHPNIWSVGQCLDHLITTNTTYFPVLRAIAAGTAKQSFWATISPFSNYFGNILLKGTGPVVTQKAKAPKPFVPVLGNVDSDIVYRFQRHQQDLLSLLTNIDGIDHSRFKITSPAASFITYRLDTGVQILVQHEERHLNQASRLRQNTEFPRS